MVSVTTLPRSRPLTHADLASAPDDGHRYELVDGTLVVTPAPAARHQRAALRLARLLDEHCPRGLEVLIAPFDVVLADDTVLQPDVLVARSEDLTDRGLPAAPVLAAEILSPSTRRVDLMLKRSRLEAAGCTDYWVVDPDAPAMIAWHLERGHYAEVAHVFGNSSFAPRTPFPVTIRPSDLVADRWPPRQNPGASG
jgi:Uma2 family endonuclease